MDEDGGRPGKMRGCHVFQGGVRREESRSTEQ